MKFTTNRLSLLVISLVTLVSLTAVAFPSVAREYREDLDGETNSNLSTWYQDRASYFENKAEDYRQKAELESEMDEYGLEELNQNTNQDAMADGLDENGTDNSGNDVFKNGF
jgi:hypothetical protein